MENFTSVYNNYIPVIESVPFLVNYQSLQFFLLRIKVAAVMLPSVTSSSVVEIMLVNEQCTRSTTI